jgi:hypothetical protein
VRSKHLALPSSNITLEVSSSIAQSGVFDECAGFFFRLSVRVSVNRDHDRKLKGDLSSYHLVASLLEGCFHWPSPCVSICQNISIMKRITFILRAYDPGTFISRRISILLAAMFVLDCVLPLRICKVTGHSATRFCSLCQLKLHDINNTDRNLRSILSEMIPGVKESMIKFSSEKSVRNARRQVVCLPVQFQLTCRYLLDFHMHSRCASRRLKQKILGYLNLLKDITQPLLPTITPDTSDISIDVYFIISSFRQCT